MSNYIEVDGVRYYKAGTNSNNQKSNSNTSAKNDDTQYKKSGATYSKIKQGDFAGETIVNAWRKTKYGLMVAVVTPYKGANGKGLDNVESVNEKTGEIKNYQKMICTIQNKSMGTSQTYHVLMNVKTQVIVINELSLCITPNGSGKTASGKKVFGYFGRNYKN